MQLHLQPMRSDKTHYYKAKLLMKALNETDCSFSKTTTIMRFTGWSGFYSHIDWDQPMFTSPKSSDRYRLLRDSPGSGSSSLL